MLVITGDGEMLMGIGALATIAVQAPRNLSILVQDNEHYGETGMQETRDRARRRPRRHGEGAPASRARMLVTTPEECRRCATPSTPAMARSSPW